MAITKYTCPMCNKGKLRLEKQEVEMLGFKLGKFPVEVCPKCGEKFFDEKTSEKINQKAKELGLWGLSRKTKVSEVGNSLAVRIPKKLAEFLGITSGTDVEVRPEGKKIVIEPV